MAPPLLRISTTRWRWPVAPGVAVEITFERHLDAHAIDAFRNCLDLADLAVTGRRPPRRAEPEPATTPPDWPTVAPDGTGA